MTNQNSSYCIPLGPIRRKKHLDVTYFKIRFELKFQFRLEIFVFVIEKS